MSKEQLQLNSEFARRPEVKRLNRALALYIGAALDSLDNTLLRRCDPTKGLTEKISIDFTLSNLPFIESVYLRTFPKNVSPGRYPGPEDEYILSLDFTENFRDTVLFGINGSGRLINLSDNNWSISPDVGYTFTQTGKASRYWSPLDPSDYELIDTLFLEFNNTYPKLFPNFRGFEQTYYRGGKRAALKMFKTKGK